MYTSDMKNALNLSLGRLCLLSLFVNVIKNNIISSVMQIIVCLPKTE